MLTVTSDHWLRGATRLPSPNADARPDADDISLVVVHGISLPPGEFGGALVQALFTNTLDLGIHPALRDLAGRRVSSHLLIGRDGGLTQFVAFDRRAWHAGASSFRGRSRCNDFAIGIELIGADDIPYAEAQYARLVEVFAALLASYPELSPSCIAGHAEVAPQRKTDPGPAFDWQRLMAEVAPLPGIARQGVCQRP